MLRLKHNAALKRLASAVQLRPWPPCFQSLTANRSLPEFPRGAGFFDHKLTSPGQGRWKAFASTLFSAVLFQDPRRSNRRATAPCLRILRSRRLTYRSNPKPARIVTAGFSARQLPRKPSAIPVGRCTSKILALALPRMLPCGSPAVHLPKRSTEVNRHARPSRMFAGFNARFRPAFRRVKPPNRFSSGSLPVHPKKVNRC